MHMGDAHRKSVYHAPRLFIRSKYEQHLFGALQACSIRIGNSLGHLQVSKRSQGCTIASTWMASSEACRMRMQITCKRLDRLKVGSFILCQTSTDYLPAFNEFIHERETNGPNDPSIMLFDQIILSKRNRGRTSIFTKSKTDFLSDTTDHLWRTAAANPPKGKIPGDYRAIVTRSKSSPCSPTVTSL